MSFDPFKTSGRRATLQETLQHVKDTIVPHSPPYIVECGSTRREEERYCKGDGWASLFFARFVKEHQGYFVTIDTDPQAIATCHRMIDRHVGWDDRHMMAVVGDAREVLARSPIGTEAIDLLYIDGPDPTGDGAKINAQFLDAVVDKFPPDFILVDDVYSEEDMGKAAKLNLDVDGSPFKRIFLKDRQALWMFKT